jgi:hypothetical protein
MAYFTDVFTVETWTRAQERRWTVSGFPPPTTTRGGYFQSTFDAVKVGDLLVCYVKAPAQRWVGILSVESPMFFDQDDALWGHDADGNVLYPARFKTNPVLTRDVEQGVPVQETVGVLSCLDEKTWSGLFRRSLGRMPQEDGDRLKEMLAEPREPTPVRIPRKRVTRSGTAALSTVVSSDVKVEEVVERKPRLHTELIWKLIQLGKSIGCDVWVASDEKGKTWESERFADHLLSEFPSVGLSPEASEFVRTIDVLWIRGRRIEAAFEVEATTSVYSGLLRMSDLVALQPNVAFDLYIVAPDERGAKVRSEIRRPTFEVWDPPLRDRCRYLSATGLQDCIERTKPPVRPGSVQPSIVRDFAELITPE